MLDIVLALGETEEWAEEWGEQVFHVIQVFDQDKGSDDENSAAHSCEEKETAECVEHEEAFDREDSEESEDEIIVPRKRARATVAPSRVPVLVSIINSPSRRQRR